MSTAEMTVGIHEVGPVDRIPLGEGRTVRIGELEIAIFRTRGGVLYATQAACPHRGGPLADGMVGGTRVVCPLHSFAFELDTGRPAHAGCPSLRTYPVSVDSRGMIQVRVED